MKLLEKSNKIRCNNKQRPNSLILAIPAQIRDLMNFTHGTPVKWTVCVEDEKIYCKIEKQD